jgi:hypothetical protein
MTTSRSTVGASTGGDGPEFRRTARTTWRDVRERRRGRADDAAGSDRRSARLRGRGWWSCCAAWTGAPTRRCSRSEGSSHCSARGRSSWPRRRWTTWSGRVWWSARREARLRALMLDTTLRRVVTALEDAGVPTLPIKGTTLADRVHGETGLRPTTDVDVLPRAQIRSAVEALRALGYAAPEDPVGRTGCRRCITRSGAATPPRPGWSCTGGCTRPSGASRTSSCAAPQRRPTA